MKPGGTQTRFVATTEVTDGQYGLFEWNMPADTGGAGAHFHRTFSESFFVMDGAVELFNGDKWTKAEKGDFLYVPPGGLHAFRNESGAPASLLMLFAPGADREGYFEGITQLGDLNDEERARFFVEHDSFFV